jgi:hypothetical protein
VDNDRYCGEHGSWDGFRRFATGILVGPILMPVLFLAVGLNFCVLWLARTNRISPRFWWLGFTGLLLNFLTVIFEVFLVVVLVL